MNSSFNDNKKVFRGYARMKNKNNEVGYNPVFKLN